MMKKTLLVASIVAVIGIVGCSSDHTKKDSEPKKEIPVTIDSQKTITEEIEKLKTNLSTVPVAHIEGASKGSVSIETEIGVEDPIIALMGTDIVSLDSEKVFANYMVTNKMRDSLKERYVKEAIGEKGTYLTDEEQTSIAWERDGWVLELIPSQQVSAETLVAWADSFSKDDALVDNVNSWFSLDEVEFISDIPGENVKFFIGLSTLNPDQKDLLQVPNRMYAMIQTDLDEVKSYQINHSALPKDLFDYEAVKTFKEIKVRDKKAWYNKETKELYWEDQKFVYHMQDNALQMELEEEFFDLEDYKKFANLK